MPKSIMMKLSTTTNELLRLLQSTLENMALVYLSSVSLPEAGEVAGKMKKWIRDGDSKMTREEWVKAMSSEIGDVLWYAARLADELDLSLAEIAEENMMKLLDRKARGVIGGSGDNR